MTYNDKTITYSGDLASYDYDAILRDKQRNINSLYELADYYVDADPIFRGIINGVYVPFSLSDDFRLVGANEQTKAKYAVCFFLQELSKNADDFCFFPCYTGNVERVKSTCETRQALMCFR